MYALLLALTFALTPPSTPAALQARRAPDSLARQAADLEEKTLTLADERKFDDAVAAGRESLAFSERAFGPTNPRVADALNTLGFVFYQKGDLAAAEPLFVRAVSIRRRSAPGDKTALAQALNQLGSVLQRQGRLPEAEPLLQEALRILTASGAKPDDLAIANNNLAGLLMDRGDYIHAREHFEKTAKLWSRVYAADDPRMAFIANNLGLLFDTLGDQEKAEASYRRALAIREKSPPSVNLAHSLNNLANTLRVRGRLDEAEPLYTRAVEICEKLPGSDAALGQALTNLAVLYLLRKDYDRAGPLYERGLQVREKALGPEHPDVATSLAAYAIFLHNTGRFGEALDVQQRASKIRERNLALVLEIGSEAQKERYLALLTDSIDVTLWMRSAAAPADAAANRAALLTILRRKGRLQDVMAASSAALRSRAPASARDDLDELAHVRASLAVLTLQARGAAADRAVKIKDLEARSEALEAKLSAQHAQPAGSAAEITIDAVQRAVPEGAVLIGFFKYRPFDPRTPIAAKRFGSPRYAAYALRHAGEPAWIEVGDAAAIDAAIGHWRGALLNPRRPDTVESARELSSTVTAAVLQLAGASEHVLLAPDGDLNLMPFQALVDEGSRYLVERYRFTYVTSGRDLLSKPAGISPGAPLVIGSPTFGRAAATSGMITRSFAPLPGADREATAVAALLPGAVVLRGAEASEARLKALQSPAVLHVATHGFYLSADDGGNAPATRGFLPIARRATEDVPALLRSGLALAGANTGPRGAEDGILTASEAALVDLRGTELVFLSACESGLGVVSAGESVYGLRRAFAIAGARSQVLTLWKVSDQETSDFVIDFYERLAAGGDRSDALRQAQRSALADPARQHPFYWAAFILSGADGPLTSSFKP
jgi:CHAT domain-containing protein/tetratricopeptide (TPR) repeat protein